MYNYKLGDGRVVVCAKNYHGWVFPNREDVPEEYRGKQFTARFGAVRLAKRQGILIIEPEGMEHVVLEESERKPWTNKEIKLAELVVSLVPRGL